MDIGFSHYVGKDINEALIYSLNPYSNGYWFFSGEQKFYVGKDIKVS